jgi:geranylgeranyl pyrophosphate synthase
MRARKQAVVLHARVQQAAELSGILGAATRHHMALAGQQFRGLLAHDLAVRLGIPRAVAVDLGAACELLHNASLVHDDIQDRDVLRRGREAAWVRFGEPVAINLGDHLLASSFAVLAALPVDAGARTRLVAAFAPTTSVIARGQSDELLRRDDHEVDRARYEQIAADKTGPLLALPLESAAIVAGLPEAQIDAVRTGGTLLGTAYQLADDVADLLDCKQRGEPGADLREGKLTWPMLDFLEGSSASVQERLLGQLAARERRTTDVQPWVRAIRAAGSLDRTLRRVGELTRAACDAWSPVPAAGRALLRRVAQRFERALPVPPAETAGVEVAK